jgi:hypothetical protein
MKQCGKDSQRRLSRTVLCTDKRLGVKACKNTNKKITTLEKNSTRKTILNENGRLQFFYHSPSSKLPIRDVLREQGQYYKTEPHIEIGAENYWTACYQKNNIVPFIRNNEKYLFLMTTCRNENLKPFFGRKFIVGYIFMKLSGENIKGIYYVKGDTFLYSFNDAIPITELGYSKWTRVKLVDKRDAKKILNHFRNRKNILQDCIMEIKRLDKDNKTCRRKECSFKTECLRWKFH